MVDVAHHGHDRRARQRLGLLRRHVLVGEGFRIVQRGNHRAVAHFLHDDHRGVLVQRLVDGRHLAQLHQLLDDFRRLDGHLVRQLGDRDGLGHVHFEHARLDRRGLHAFFLAATVIAATPARAAAPVAAADAAAGIAAGLDFLLLGGVAGPARGELGRLDFLARAGRRGAGCARRGRTGRRCGRLVQRALDACGLGFRRRLLGRLVRHQHAGRRIHHGANGFGLGQRLAAALVEVLGARGFLVGTGLRFGGRLGLGVFLDLGGSGFGGGLAVGHGRGFLGRFGRAFGHGGGSLLSGCLGTRGAGGLLGLLGALGLLALARFGFLAQAALLDQLFLLAADQLGLAARLFLAARELGLVDARRGGLGNGRRRSVGDRLHRLGRGRMSLVALDEGALLAHLDLDRARTAGGVGLLDLGGRLLGQRDLLALGVDRAVAGLQEAEQALLVGLGERVGDGSLGHARALELVKQDFGRLLELVRELGDSGTGHIAFVPP